MKQLSIIVPVFNEAEYILPFYYDLKKYLPQDFELIWVDDGSTDSTLAEIEHLVNKDERICCISLSRNFGKPNAVAAGLDYAKGETIIIMNGNLQHPASLIPQMLYLIANKQDVITAVAANCAKTFELQKKLLNKYYKILEKISNEKNHRELTDFRVFKTNILPAIYKKNNISFLAHSFYLKDVNAAEIEYLLPKCKKEETRYTIQHLIQTTRTAFKKRQSEIIRSLLLTGISFIIITLLCGTSLFLNYLNKGNLSITPVLLLSVLFLGGVQMLVYSISRKRMFKKIHAQNTGSVYNIRDIIEHEQKSMKFSYN